MPRLEISDITDQTTLAELQQLVDEHELTVRCASRSGSRQIAVTRGSLPGSTCISSSTARPFSDQLREALRLLFAERPAPI